MAKSAFWRGFSALAPYTGIGPIQCLDEICNVHPPLHTLKIWGGRSTPRGARRPSLSVCLFFYVAAKATYIRLLLGQNGVFLALAP